MLFLLPSRLSPSSRCARIIVMGSKNFLLPKSSAAPATCAYLHSFHGCSSSSPRTFLFDYYSGRRVASPKHLLLSYQSSSGCSYSTMPVPRPISDVEDDVETLGKPFVDSKEVMILKQKLQTIGIHPSSYTPGQYNHLSCPSCKGGESNEKSLSLHITEDSGAAVWTCFRGTCGWKGTTRAFAGVKSTYETMSKAPKIKASKRIITEEDLALEPLCSQLIGYFAGRMISEETLLRNDVVQKKVSPNQIAIAFTYRRNGDLVSCKYCRIPQKFFWQEANTEKIFYGLDDIKDASEIIIVEGEMDKLSMEEAGFKNCVSVPDGAPPKVSNTELPAEEEDTKYQYLWNCKEYTDKASRIILATDADAPGQALAEELARRLGRERCWRVKWPKKSDTESYKDANEVLMYMGPDALRDVINNAELYSKHLLLSYQGSSGCGYTPYSTMPVPRPISDVEDDVETLGKPFVDSKEVMILKQKLQTIGIHPSSYTPGQYNHLSCPSCKGGESNEKSLSLHITEDSGAAVWTCFRGTCGWKGTTRAFAGVKSTYETMSKAPKIKASKRIITEEDLALEPLCSQLIGYFAGRMISEETLLRNDVVQKKVSPNQIAIAFTYRRNGDLVSCKYCRIPQKFFWQEANTEKIFYGLDDIKDASEIIIVEGEMDKLSMEEAGFKNCVSVPDGAPPKVSNTELPAEEEDTKYQYLWNCKEYTDKASRIILATDADAPGQALAEELARRLGRERCWRVKWPKKSDTESYKDANEVLMYMGPDALRDVINNAELYSKHLLLSYQGSSGCGYTPYSTMPVPRPISDVEDDVETLGKQFVDSKTVMILKETLQTIGIHLSSYRPGQYNGLSCPSCKGGETNEKSLSLHITKVCDAAMWTCFQAKCGWMGYTHAIADSKSTYGTIKRPKRIITEEGLALEPLCSQLLAYFADRMISGETLRRNDVMQKRVSPNQIAIAFAYRRNEDLVSCKYRDITRKRFWQEANTEKIFYGLDDIKDASDIIIVEGEMDKLSMEEAGFKNCVSVPDGAPYKELPAKEEDKSYQYLWNCEEYTEKASRIILATDADAPGQALAEGLARRLGRERCWRVKWPKKSDGESYKDANEVLMYMGPDALRDVIDNAELYPIGGLFF